MKHLATSLALALVAIVTVAAGCGKDDKPAAKDPAPAAGAPAAGAAADPAPTPDDGADYVRVLATHVVPKPTDPVTIAIPGFRVVSADFDPANLEGGTATLALDLASLDSGSAKRDKHLRSDDYLDVGAFATATITIGNVKRAADRAYTADATVDIHGVQQTLPVRFDVIETSADGVRIQAEHRFSRHVFAIGAAEGQEDSVAPDLTIQLRLTLKKG